MAWRIVKQPNGLLACFDDVVDNFTHVNMMQQQALDLCLARNMGEDDAFTKILRGIDRETRRKPLASDMGISRRRLKSP